MLGRLLGWTKPKVTAKSGAWEFSLIGGATTLQLTVLRGSRPATFAQVFSGWADDPDFRLAFSDTLTTCQFSGFRWELPRLTSTTVQKPYECVILDSPSLLVPRESQRFFPPTSPRASKWSLAPSVPKQAMVTCEHFSTRLPSLKNTGCGRRLPD